MKKILTALFAALLLTGAAHAQGNSGKKGGAKKGEVRKEAAADIGLTPVQKVAMGDLKKKHRAEMEALKVKESTLTVSQMKAERKALHDRQKAEMTALLTAEQKAQLEAKREEGKANRGKGKGAATPSDSTRRGSKSVRGKGGKEYEMIALDLSADQKARLKTIRSEYAPKMQAVRNNTALTEEARRAEIKTLMEAERNAMKAVLTPTQLKHWKTSRKAGKRKGANMPV